MTLQDIDEAERRDDPPVQRSQAVQPLSIDSRTLFDGAQELLIQHQSQTYRLRITSQGKLILTK